MPLFDVKSLSIGAAVGFGLSFLMGIFSGVSFGVLLFRALVFGILGAGFVLLFRFAWGKFQMDSGAESAQDDEAREEGRQVDIVLPGEDILPAGRSGSADGLATTQAAAFAREELVPRDSDVDDEFSNEIATEVEEIRRSPLVEPSEPEAKAARPPSLLDDVDVLPDLDGFQDSFASPIAGDDGDGGNDDSVGFQPMEDLGDSHAYGARGSGGAGGDKNPEMIAKAVRTLLKKDEKG